MGKHYSKLNRNKDCKMSSVLLKGNMFYLVNFDLMNHCPNGSNFYDKASRNILTNQIQVTDRSKPVLSNIFDSDPVNNAGPVTAATGPALVLTGPMLVRTLYWFFEQHNGIPGVPR